MYRKVENFFFKSFFKSRDGAFKKNDKVLVYSDLSKFGIYSKNLPQIVFKSLRKKK